MKRNEIPTWALTKPGEYETRDGSKAVVEFRCVCPNEKRGWVGYVVGEGVTICIWYEDGRHVVDDLSIIGPWIEGGLPFDCVLDPATADADLLRRFKDARKAGLVIEFKSKSASNQHWCVVQWPFFNGLGVYRLRGSTADWTPPQTTLMQPEQITYPKIESVTTPEPVSLTEHQLQQVREIVAAALYNWWLRAGMPADWRPEQ